MAIAAPFPAARPLRSAGPMRSAGPRRQPAPDQVQLTSRGRAVLVVGSALFLFLVVVLSGGFTAQAGSGSAGPATGVIVVQSGETLWQLAQQVAPDVDPRATVLEIRELNGLSTEAVVPGMSLVVPLVR